MKRLQGCLLMLALLCGLVAFLLWWVQESFPLPQLTALQAPRLTSKTEKLGSFVLHWDKDKRQLFITHTKAPARKLWSSVPGYGFVAGAVGREEIHESRGSFFVRDHLQQECLQQTLQKIERKGDAVVLSGFVQCDTARRAYTLTWTAASPTQLRFALKLQGLNRARLLYQSGAKERFYGFGEQFTYMDLKGKRLPIFVMEQGIGRGAQPITWGANLTAKAGGDWHTSYAGVPHYMTSQRRSLFLENTEYSVFDMRRHHSVQLSVFSNRLTGRVLYGSSPLALLESYTEYAGRMKPLPDWIHKGAIIGMQGGTAKVHQIWKKLKAHDAPIAAFWLQDWVGQRKTSFGRQLWWNWELDREHYPRWKGLKAALTKSGIRVLLYINPFLADVSQKTNARRNLYEEARKKGLLVKNKDGQPYMILNTSFSAALLDLTNPRARIWIQKVMQDEMLKIGGDGWMADFGEALPYDSTLHKGTPATVHNRYPQLWADVNKKVLQSTGKPQDFVYFMRSGYTRSPGKTSLFWLGDQLVSWDHHDGIKTAVTGLLSSGLSGYSLNHSDIGGYTTITHPIRNYHRSEELHMRWAELNAMTVVFRTHEGNRPAANHQFHSTPKSLKHFVRCAKLYKAWAPYRKTLVKEASQRGWPVVRHPFLHFPEDKVIQSLSYQQFMVGSELMVAPVLDKNVETVKVYLPKGRWRHLWSGKLSGNNSTGSWLTVAAPLGKPAIFYKANSKPGEAFRKALHKAGLLTTNQGK